MSSNSSIRRGDQMALAALTLPMQALYLLAPMLIECDATMFLNYGRFFTTGIGLNPIRPPGFPLLLALTALPFDSLTPVMALHAAMGIAMPILIYRTLAPFHRPLALAAAVADIVSTLPFASAKMLLADQLFAFLLVASMHSLSRLYWTQQPRHVYGAVLLACAAWLTRWEGMLFVPATVMIAFWCHPTRVRLRPLAKAVGIGLTVVLAWSVVRATQLKDYSLVGSVSNGTGLQLMHRQYLDIPHLLLDWETLVVKTRSQSDAADLIQDSGGYPGIRVIAPANGPSSARLRALVEQEAREYPESLRSMQAAMGSAYQDPQGQRIDTYRELIGRFDGDPAGFAENFFVQPSNFLLDWMWGRLQARLGLAGADALYRNVAAEGLLAHPRAVEVAAADVFTFFGLNLRSIVMNDGSPRLMDMGFRSSYYLTPFNIANCAKAGLTPHMFAEYERDWKLTDIVVVGRLMEWGDFYGRNVVQMGLGLLSLATWWVLPFSPHRRFFLLLPCVALVMMGTTALAVGGAWASRYQLVTFPIMLVSTAGALITVQGWLSNRLAVPFGRSKNADGPTEDRPGTQG